MDRFIRKTNRLQVPGIYEGGQYYFVTILVKERACIFDILESGDCAYNKSDNLGAAFTISQILEKELRNINKFYKGTELIDFVIMPNHIHAVIAISQKSKTSLSQIISTFKSITYKHIKQRIANVTESPSFPSFPSFPPCDNINSEVKSGNLDQSGNLGVAFTISNLIENYNTIWHKSFHDHIIRNETELFAIRKYIQDNPMGWKLDEFNPKRQGD